jgi:hypothetical protein
MFEEWGAIEWFLLLVNVIAVTIAARFLIWKIRKKFEEVEKRQKHSIRTK